MDFITNTKLIINKTANTAPAKFVNLLTPLSESFAKSQVNNEWAGYFFVKSLSMYKLYNFCQQ